MAVKGEIPMNTKGYSTIGSYVFEPFIPGGGPNFVLTMYDTYRFDKYGKHILAYRLSMGSDVNVERLHTSPDTVLFEGCDFHTHADIGSNEMIAGIMGFLVLRPGDTDDEYFSDYTHEQLTFCSKYAEALACECMCRYGED